MSACPYCLNMILHAYILCGYTTDCEETLLLKQYSYCIVYDQITCQMIEFNLNWACSFFRWVIICLCSTSSVNDHIEWTGDVNNMKPVCHIQSFTRVKILHAQVGVSLHANAFEKIDKAIRSPSNCEKIIRFTSFGKAASLEVKLWIQNSCITL